MPYWIYYLLWPLLAYAARQPWLVAGVVLFFLLRRYIPDPGALWRALRRAGALKQQVAVNPANVTARRDLAVLYLDLLRPKAALGVIDEARARHPDDPELLLLYGTALHRAGRHEDALEPLVRADELKPGLRYGLPYLMAGEALYALGRYEEAIDAYERYTSVTSSDVGAYTRLARAHAHHGERDEAKKAIYQALDTWRHIPPGMRRRSIGRWFEAQWARVWLLREPGALVAVVAVVALAAVAARYSAPSVRALFHRTPPAAEDAEPPI